MGRVKYRQTRARGQQQALLERPAVTTKRKNANKQALRRAKSNASFLSQSPLAMFSDPIYIREQCHYQRGRRHAEELAELRNKRRWVQGQLDDDHMDGSTARELLKLYDKTYFGKPQGQRPRVEDMSGGAKLVNQHLEHAIEHRLGAFGDDAGDQSHGAGSTAGPVDQYFDSMDGVAVKDEKGEKEGEEGEGEETEEKEEKEEKK